jgi:hypothetical protein
MRDKSVNHEDSIAILAQGLAHSKWIKMISWSMLASSENPQNITPIMALIEGNKQLELLNLGCRFEDELGPACLFKAL